MAAAAAFCWRAPLYCSHIGSVLYCYAMELVIKPIKTEADYDAALATVETIMGAEADTSEGDHLDVLVTLIEAYEAKHWPIDLPDPIEAIKLRMTQRGLTRKDLEPLLGSRGRVTEILNRKRPLTLAMIRRLHAALGIPLECLVAAPVTLSMRRRSSRHGYATKRK